MDAAFEVLLPMGEADSIFPFEPPMFEWGGVKYPQGSPEYLYDSNYKLIKSPIRPHIMAKLPDSYKKINWECIDILGEGLRNYRTKLLDIGPEYYDNVLSRLLQDLLVKTTKWAVVFEPDYDFHLQVKEGTLSTVIDKLRFSLSIQKYGFIICGGVGVNATF